MKTKKVDYLTIEDVLVLHAQLIDIFGGRHGIRDTALLESSVVRPQMTFGSQELYESIYDKAAVLIHGIISNHAFIDSNKRTGISAGLIFLDMNGVNISVIDEQIESVALKITAKEWEIEEIATWLENSTD